MFGPIIAAPLAKPVMRTSPAIHIHKAGWRPFIRVSVVQMAWATSFQAVDGRGLAPLRPWGIPSGDRVHRQRAGR